MHSLEPIHSRCPGAIALLGGTDTLQDPRLDHLNGRRTLLTRRLLGGVGEKDGHGLDVLDGLCYSLGVGWCEGADDDERDVGAGIAFPGGGVGPLAAGGCDFFAFQESGDL